MEKGEDSEDLVEVRRREVLARWRSGEASEVEGRRWRGGKWKRGLRETRREGEGLSGSSLTTFTWTNLTY